MQTLSKQQAKKLIVLSNDFHHHKKLKTYEGTLATINTLGYVQIDTISVVNRAHLHVLWSRNHNFQQSHIDTLFKQKKIFEYWSHAAAMLPISDYQYSLFRKHQIANGSKHWHERDPKMMAKIKSIIVKEGAKKSSDFKHERNGQSEWWDWKPAKLALEQLFMEGELMVEKRQGFQKVYDLTQRILSEEVITTRPTTEEFCRHLIMRYLFTQGIGNAEQIAYLRKGLKVCVKTSLKQMLYDGEVENVIVNNKSYYVLPERLSLLNKRVVSEVHILSPFDNMVIQRDRLQKLFDYDYQIECYVPAAKRRFGYFCLPILFGRELVGRVDCKAHRKDRVLKINAIYAEKSINNKGQYNNKLDQALREFSHFNDCDEVVYKSCILK